MLLWIAFLLACPSVDEDTDASAPIPTDADTDTDPPEDACGPAEEPDCAPEDPEVGPLHPERIGDGVDQDCDGSDATFRWWDAPTVSEVGLAGPRLAALDGDVYLGMAWVPARGAQPVFGLAPVQAACPGVWAALTSDPEAGTRARVGLILGGWQVVQLEDPVMEEGPVAWDVDSLLVGGKGVWAEARGAAGAVVAVDGVEAVAVDADARAWTATTRAGAWGPAEEVVPPLACVDEIDVRVGGDGLTVLAVRCGLELSWAAYHPR